MTSLKVASLNLCNFCAPPYNFYDFESCYSTKQWQEKEAWLTSLVSESCPDVICFQEVFSVAELKQLLYPLGLTFFACVDLPQAQGDNPYLYKRPTILIASRFEISDVTSVTPQTFINMAPVSRDIVRCEVKHPSFGLLRFYGCHLKSKRAMDLALLESFDFQTPSKQLAVKDIANLLSDKQRFDEALALYTDFLLQQSSNLLPTFVMGDFNQQTIQSSLAFLTDETESKQKLDGDFKLLDSFYLSQLQTRKPTHYYYGNGSVLDYILCPESVLSQLNLNKLDFNVTDEYVSQDEINQTSDHAFVCITLK